ncbi:hypothetical protein CBS101457_004195 [Exobasidium rhododendri]|nr:hypothetical protein CBS101457_004195 [Exobasidium rhododendri]
MRLNSEWFMYHQSCLPIVGHAWQDHRREVSSHIGSIRGLKALKSAVYKELQWVEKHAAEVGKQTIFTSSNTFYLTTLWQHVLYSALHESPVIELDAYFPTGIKSQTSRSAKVDIVCESGRKWIRLSTIKPLSILSEFRSAESYVVEDDESSSDSDGGRKGETPPLSLETIKSQLALGQVDGIASQCSIMKMARELQKAADVAESKQTWGRPIVEVVLTRLGLEDMTSTLEGKFYDADEKGRFEARIKAMLKELEGMQLKVLLKNDRKLYDDEVKQMNLPSAVASAEYTSEEQVSHLPRLSSPPVTQACPPTTTLNLDLSALVAFVSQISHLPLSHLPNSEDIDTCFRKEHWKADLQTKAADIDEKDGVIGEQTDAEKNHHTQHARALSDQLRREMTNDSFFDALLDGVEEGQKLRLICTQEAAEKFTEILSLVGGPTEQRRAKNLLDLNGQDDFWSGSRWESKGEVRHRILLPVQPIAFSVSDVSFPPAPIKSDFDRLARSSVQEGLNDLLEQSFQSNLNANNVGTGVQRQTTHTLASLLYGLVNGYTTLTTNIASIKWLMRDIARNEAAEAKTKGYTQQASLDPFAFAVLFYPRSLAEKMMTSTYLTSHACDLRTPPDTPLDWSGDTATDDIRLVTRNSSGTFKDDLKTANGTSLQNTMPITELGNGRATAAQDRTMRRTFRVLKRWLYGPRPHSTLIIRHYPWWPLQSLEGLWLKWTSPLAWKDHALTQGSVQLPDVEEQHFPSDGLDGNILGDDSRKRDNLRSGAHRDWKLNRLHWIALALTYIAWAFGFTFLVKDLWYEAVVLGPDGSQSSPSFFDCTTTFWSANSICGLNGNLCSPFSSQASIPFRCPASCETTTLGGRRAVGDQVPSRVTLVVGGGAQGNSTSVIDEDEASGPFIYRGDSFICSAAIHAGTMTREHGGCSSIWLAGAYSGYQGIERNGIESTSFNSSFPVSFFFDDNVEGEKCTDRSDRGYILNVILLAWVGFVLQPKRIVYFFTLIVVGFWHINFVSEPREYPMSVGDPMGDFLPTLFVAYGLWRVTFRFVWPAFERLPLERNMWIQGFFWIGVLLNLVFANVPLDRLVASDIASQPGALTALVVIVVIVLVIAVNQIRVIRKVGKLPKYLFLTIIGGIIVGLLSAIPTTGFRLHHYIIAMVLLPYTAFPTRLSLIYSAFLIGMFLNGVGRWGYDGIIQDVATIRGSGIIGTGLPSFLPPSNWTGVPGAGGVTNSTGFVHWSDIPSSQTDQWDSFQLLVDDVLRLQSSETSYNISQLTSYFLASSSSSLDTLSAGLVPVSNLSSYPGGSDDAHVESIFSLQPHFLRLAFYNSNTANLGDFTEAATLYFNGTFTSPPSGST